jgi:hypothetical protein
VAIANGKKNVIITVVVTVRAQVLNRAHQVNHAVVIIAGVVVGIVEEAVVVNVLNKFNAKFHVVLPSLVLKSALVAEFFQSLC